jgi:hypothetical protein
VPTIRSDVINHAAGDVPADFAINVVYHNNTDITGVLDVGWQSHADEIRDAFTGADPDDPSFALYNSRVVEVKCYDLADAEPRPVRAHSIFNPGTPAAPDEIGPRQVALCLSYYAGRNLPATRGRIYVGPINAPPPVPNTGVMNEVMALGNALFNIGGANVHWQQHSEKTGVSSTITDIWVDNRWDTQRRRLVKATARQHRTF